MNDKEMLYTCPKCKEVLIIPTPVRSATCPICNCPFVIKNNNIELAVEVSENANDAKK